MGGCVLAATKLSMPFQVPGLWFDLKEIFFLGLGLTVTEISIKKSTEIKTLKDVGMACQKVCKQGRDDIIALQSPIPTSFYTTVVL